MESDEEGGHRENVERGHAGNADSVAHSYTTEGEDDGAEEKECGATFLALLGYIIGPFQTSLDTSAPNFPVRSSPPPDVKVSMRSSAITQPGKKQGSLFSLTSLFNASGTGRFHRPGYLKMVEAVLRCAAAVFSLIAFCVMSSTREMRVAAGSTFEVKFSDYQAYNYLVALNVLTFAYSSAQVVVVLQSSSNSSSIFASPLRSGICKYFCDEILAICLFSASSSAATASAMSHHGLRYIWPPACSTWKLWMFCSKADAAVVI
ncbi:hypothetical protein GOP47_0018604 [Adiantum capillus-veneris]|uniref:CASP-like protein n=1 Tax=Adiantum capillus-veneris TaxID=13818 RepID=A0A9D4Z9S2_ADICA|nr:hypothetical protein GOP47_0018604 [Adiantum capillus-veneris]